MTDPLYRQQALRRFSSPERTDRLLQIVSSKAWLALVALATAMAAALIWGILGRVPTNVVGSGIVQFHLGGTRAVVAQESGILTEMLSPPGSMVAEGDIVARISMYSTMQQAEGARITLRNVEEERHQLDAFYSKYMADQDRLYARQREGYAALLKDLAQRITAQQAVLDGTIDLHKSGFASAVQEQSAREKLMTLMQQREQTLVSALQVDTQEQAAINQRAHDLQSNTEKQIQAQNQLNSYEEQLRIGSDIRAPVSGKVVQFEAQLHTIVTVGTTVALIEFGENKTAAVIYVPTTQGKLIGPGMRANVSPTTVKPEQYGDIIGTVQSVAAYPATPTDMMRSLNNSTLVSTFAAAGPPLEVLISLKQNPDTVSGFSWTSAAGPPIKITSGTIATATIDVEDDPPITLVIPFFKKFFGL